MARNPVTTSEPTTTSITRTATRSSRGFPDKTAFESSGNLTASKAGPSMKANGSVPCETAKVFKPGKTAPDTTANGKTIRLTERVNSGT